MKFTVSRDALVSALQLVAGVVERRSTMPVLSNVLLKVEGQQLTLVGTDLEVELVGRVKLIEPAIEGAVTVPGKKFVDIAKSLPDDAMISMVKEGDRMVLRSDRSRFNLATLPAEEFPASQDMESDLRGAVTLVQKDLRQVMDATAFSMAVSDVRYYLNGMLFEVHNDRLRTVATDGHRLSTADVIARSDVEEPIQVIVPRKGVMELARLIAPSEQDVTVHITQNHIRVDSGDFTFTSKLVDGRFPDYQRVIPQGGDNNEMVADRQTLRAVLTRASILSNEKFRSVRFVIEDNNLQILANNPEQEEAEENMAVDYQNAPMDVAYNVGYIQDVLGAVEGEQVVFTLDANASTIIRDFDAPERATYVVMPMRL